MAELKIEINDVKDCSDCKLISMIGVFDSLTDFQPISKSILDIIESGFCKLIFDYTELKYINSAGIREMVIYGVKCSEKGGIICIVGASDNIIEVCEAAGLAALAEFCENINEAILKIKSHNSCDRKKTGN